MRARGTGLTVLLLALAACTGSNEATPLPGASGAAARTTTPAALRTPAPDDVNPAEAEVDATRRSSPAQGPVTLSVRGGRPAGEGGAAYDAYLGWVRASLTAFARPGEDDGGLRRYAAPAVVRQVDVLVRELVLRGWAEYGAATVAVTVVRVQGAAATVAGCLDLSGVATRDAAGRLARRATPVRSLATLTRSGSRWLVTADRRTGAPRC